MFGNDIKKWLYAAGVRAFRTACQTALATIGTGTVMGDVSWTGVLSASTLAAILSLLTSMAGLPELKETEGGGHGTDNQA